MFKVNNQQNAVLVGITSICLNQNYKAYLQSLLKIHLGTPLNIRPRSLRKVVNVRQADSY